VAGGAKAISRSDTHAVTLQQGGPEGKFERERERERWRGKLYLLSIARSLILLFQKTVSLPSWAGMEEETQMEREFRKGKNSEQGFKSFPTASHIA